jgi:hypothetical protein
MSASEQTPPGCHAQSGERQIAADKTMTGEPDMLMTIAIILLVLWVLGLVSSYTMGGLIHILLVVAIVVFLVQFIQGRRG